MVEKMDLSYDLAAFGIKPLGISGIPVDGDGRITYSLLKIPRVDNRCLAARQVDGGLVGRLVDVSERNLLPITEEKPLNRETIKELVYIARGFYPPEQYDIANHPFPSRCDSDTHGM